MHKTWSKSLKFYSLALFRTNQASFANLMILIICDSTQNSWDLKIRFSKRDLRILLSLNFNRFGHMTTICWGCWHFQLLNSVQWAHNKLPKTEDCLHPKTSKPKMIILMFTRWRMPDSNVSIVFKSRLSEKISDLIWLWVTCDHQTIEIRVCNWLFVTHISIMTNSLEVRT